MFEIKDEASSATIYIYGTIGDDWWSEDDSNRAKDLSQKLDELSPKPIDIRIDSAGGDVYEGFAIASAIQRYEGPTHAYVDGMAASAASYIALMADKISINDYAMIMIHNAWTYTSGNRNDLRAVAERLEGLDSTIAGIISKRSGLTLEETIAAMDAETWYTGEQALEAGMVDEVIETEERMAACIDIAMEPAFKHVPKNVCRRIPGITSEIVTNDKTEGQSDENNDEQEKSHAENTLSVDEAEDAAEFIVLGNRVYRKETENDDQ